MDFTNKLNMTPAPKHTPNPLRIEYEQKISEALIGEAKLTCNKQEAQRLYVLSQASEKLEKSHDKLVEALQAAQWALQIANNNINHEAIENERQHALEQISAALAAVEGE